MGNTSSNQVEAQVNVSSNTNQVSEEDQLIGQILDVSKELLSKYNQEFLKEDFCFDMSIVLQESLDKLSIPVLQDIGNRVLKEGEQTPQMKMIMQYTPKGDEKFFIEGFEKQLEDYFWNQPMKMNRQIFEKEGLDVPNVQFFEESNQTSPKFRYIDVTKINELLRDAQYRGKRNQNREMEENVEVSNVKIGGANLQNFKRELNSALSNPKGNKNGNISKLQKKKVEIVENMNQSKNEVNLQLLRNSLKNSSSEMVPVKSMANEKPVNQSKNSKMNMVLNKLENEIREKNRENQKMANQKEVAEKKENIKNAVNKIVQNVIPTPPVVKKNEVKEEKVNEKRHNRQKEKESSNSMVQYRIRKEYEKPTPICLAGMEKCSMTKKELCKVIADNLMIRCNIVAAILTVLPNRKSRTGSYGGYLYSKFVNLGKCQVCVPYNYKDLMDRDPIDLIKQVVHYADFLDYKSCKENGGYYMKLSKAEMEALYQNVPEDGKVSIGKQMNYNAFYVECAKKLKESYFGNLKMLLEILESLRSQPIINNVTLNELGKKTREIIDSMYHLCQYYYIYAIVSILHANLSVAKSSDIELQKTLAKSLKKNSPSESS